MTRMVNISRDNLSDLMDFEHPIRVWADGTVSDISDVYAPTVYAEHSDGTIPFAGDLQRAGWTLLTGWTGQYGYRGPVMHASEFIGGALADHILSTPGIYVAVVVTDIDDDSDDNVAGWAIAFRDAP